jgi:hypothetical protein
VPTEPWIHSVDSDIPNWSQRLCLPEQFAVPANVVDDTHQDETSAHGDSGGNLAFLFSVSGYTADNS